jgi:hypothetical protein
MVRVLISGDCFNELLERQIMVVSFPVVFVFVWHPNRSAQCQTLKPGANLKVKGIHPGKVVVKVNRVSSSPRG